MGSKPKKEEYKASEAEKTEARVAGQKAKHFRDNYAPLNAMELRNSMSDDVFNLERGRGNAVTMPALTYGNNHGKTKKTGAKLGELSGD